AVTLYKRKRVMVAQHKRHGCESDLFCDCRQKTECGERIPVPRASPTGLTGGYPDALAAGEVVTAKPIGRLRDAADGLDRGVLPPRQRRTADVGDDGSQDGQFHCRGSSPARM